MTNYLACRGNTCIFVIVDRFSKFCKLIPLPGLPTAMVTAELMFNHVFHYYGLPEDISDRGPLLGLEGLLLAPRCDHQSVFWIPSPDQWID